jgi:UDP-2,4-diacetamido-2,4,6-trideoxy-beta-L-altropyranose hydrolase
VRNNKIYFRADGNSESGYGHLYRSYALAQMLSKEFDIQFNCKEIPEQFENELKNSGFELYKLSSENDFISIINDGNIVVLDGYNFDSQYHLTIKDNGCDLVVIDDNTEGYFHADIIINQAPGISVSDYNTRTDSILALGPDYALLRAAFIEEIKQNEFSKESGSILICFGGSDVQNLTYRSIRAVLDFNHFKKITIITGSGFSYHNTLHELLNSHENIELHTAINEDKMAKLMSHSAVAIVPASSVLFEALATRNITISGMYVDNQRQIYNGFKKQKAIIDAGVFRYEDIISALGEIENHKPKNIIDGKSPERFCQLFNNILK